MQPASDRWIVPSGRVFEIRLLYRAAMLLFLITVAIGILNGLDLLEFQRNRLLTHVHAGTLGWITLSAFAFALWLLPGQAGGTVRASTFLAVASIPVFLAGLWLYNDGLAAVGGGATLLSVIGFTSNSVMAYRASAGTPARLAVVAALVTLTVGSTFGALIQIQRAARVNFLPSDAIGAHVGAQVVGYLIIMGMALAEWHLLRDAPLTRGARTQVALLFTGGLLTTLGALLSSDALLGLFIPLEIAALVIFMVRVGPRLRRVDWLGAGAERHFAAIVPFLVANVILLAVLIGGVVSGKYADFEVIPPWLVFAFDHAMFIGVMTNGLVGLGMLLVRSRERGSAWVDHVAFWAMNGALIGFVVGLTTESVALKRMSAPVMGAGILLALGAAWFRLGAASRESAGPRVVGRE